MSKKKIDPRPEVLRIEELVTRVKDGDIKLPKFQRPFVWKKTDILKLLDSIYRGYPIGSILLWHTKQELASENKIGELDIKFRSEDYPFNYLLDGQQRLSSLCGTLYWNGANVNSEWNVSFDVEKEEFVHSKGEEKLNYFPLNKLMDTSSFLNQCKAFEASPKKEKYTNNATKLLNSIKDYKLASVTIGDMELDEVAPIFERINSSGRQLTMVDLMRAATWKGGFDLSDAIDEVKNACEDKNFELIQNEHILRNISACAGLGIHKESIDKLRDKAPDELKIAAKSTKEAYTLAVDFVTTELPLKSIKNLPYGLQLTLLVEFFNLNPRPTYNEKQILKSWFWKSSFSKYYGSANTGLITSTLKDVRAFALREKEEFPIETVVNFEGFAKDYFRLNKATSTAYALLLANNQPLSFLNGDKIDTYKSLANINRLEFHHIFPKAFLNRLGVSDKKINYHSNICMLNLGDNREILDKKPSEYFKEMENNLGESFWPVLKSNFINETTYESLKIDDYDGFVDERSKLIVESMKTLVLPPPMGIKP